MVLQGSAGTQLDQEKGPGSSTATWLTVAFVLLSELVATIVHDVGIY